MSRFSPTRHGTNKTKNHEGEVAYKLPADLELYSLACTFMLGDKFYESAGQQTLRLRNLLKRNDHKFIGQLAVYAREKMYLRTLPVMLAVELARMHKGDNLVSKVVSRIIQRADEICEVLGYYQIVNKRSGEKLLGKMSKQLQKGVAQSFHKFDEYQFSKYNRDGAVKLKDAMFLCHPKPLNEKEIELFKKIADDKLEIAYTWETKLSEKGKEKFENDEQKKEAFKETWEELIFSGKLGYMALLRNLRNILEANVGLSAIKAVCQMISSPIRVAKSKQLPFRFLSAYRELKQAKILSPHVSLVLDALNEATKCTAVNIKGFDWNTVVCIACDVSGSMQTPISPRSKVQYFDIGIVLGNVLKHKCNTGYMGMFGNTWKLLNLPKENILGNADEMHRREGEVGYSTNGYLIPRFLREHKIAADKVMLFTDNQFWNSNDDKHNFAEEWFAFKKFHPTAQAYIFSLAGYADTPIEARAGDCFFISGWSDKVFEAMDAMKNGASAVDEIKKIEL